MSHTSSQDQTGLPPSHIAAIVSGNALEFYDFLTYAFFAPQIGRALFPGTGSDNLLFSLVGFGLGFLTRPIGGIVLGTYADRVGRKPAMVLSFILMGLSTLGMVFVPSFAAIGYAAPALAIALRLVGGFALGGEVGPSTAYLFEAAPPHRRGLYVSFQYATQQAAILIAGLVGLILASTLSPSELDQWGWRIGFLVGALILPFGILLRRRLRDDSSETRCMPGEQPSKTLGATALAALLLFGGTTICVFTVDYMTTYAQVTLKLGAVQAFAATAVIGIAGALADLAGGWMSDAFGRKRATLPPMIALLVLTVPAFSLLASDPGPAVLYCVAALLAILVGLWITPAMVLVTETFPAARRAAGLAFVYALAISAFGGSTQAVVTWLSAKTGSPLAPAWYMTGATALALCATFLLRDTCRAGFATKR